MDRIQHKLLGKSDKRNTASSENKQHIEIDINKNIQKELKHFHTILLTEVHNMIATQI